MTEEMNTRNLRLRRKGYYAVQYVPVHLQEKAAKYYCSRGKRLKEIVRGLGTRDLREANRRKIPVLAQIASELAAIQTGNLQEKALEIAKVIDVNSEHDDDFVISQAEQIEKDYGYEKAKRFYDVATRKALPVSVALERWMKAADGISEATKYQYERDIKAFVEWSDDMTVQSVDEDTVSMWRDHLVSTPTRNNSKIAPNTLNRKIGSLNRLWKWMKARKIFKGTNYWDEILVDVPGERRRGTTVKELRGGDKTETRKYLKAIKESRMKFKQAGLDVVTLLWHTGIRPGDICELTTDRVLWDDKDDIFWLTILGKKTNDPKGGKTAANARVMPVVSPEAIAILKRRVGDAVDGVLFHELPPEKRDRNRYARLQRKINPIRKKALPDAPLDTYSGRRSFSQACEDAGLNPVQHSRLMGHEAPILAAAVYNRGHEGRRLMLEGIKKVHKEMGEIGDY